ncbi:MAG: hypothetical protein ABL921_20035 [Pirellula sp.]
MADANVKSLEAIEVFLDAVAKLRHDTGMQADEIKQQLQRVSLWLEKELPEYWGNEKRIAEKKWIEARQELLRCQAKSRSEDESSCSVQQLLLRKATERRKLCEERVRMIPKYTLEWNQFLLEITSQIHQLEDLSETTLLGAWNKLGDILESLKKYAAQ